MKIPTKCWNCADSEIVKPRSFNTSCHAYYYPTIKWSVADHLISTDITHEYWSSGRKKKPDQGNMRVVKVSFPFNQKVGDHFWAFYIDEDFYEDEQNTEEKISNSAFLLCHILKLLKSDDHCSWILLDVVEKIDLDDIPLKVPQRKLEDSFFRNFSFYECYEYEEYNKWIYYHAGGNQGDLHEWALIKKEDTTYNIVAFGRYSFHENWSFLCNVPMTSTEYEKFEMVNTTNKSNHHF